MRPDEIRLTHPPLVEALLELHFPKVSDFLAYGPVPGRLFERLSQAYPNASDLDTANLPLLVETVTPLVRHRFTDDTGLRLFQVGNGIVSANCLGYETYPDFRDQVADVASVAVQILGAPRRATLRYINKIPTGGRAMEDVLTVGLNLPDGDWTRQSATCSRTVPDLGEFQMMWARPVDGNVDLLLFDLQVTSGALGSEPDLDSLLSWMDRAHSEIEMQFFLNVEPKFMEEALK